MQRHKNLLQLPKEGSQEFNSFCIIHWIAKLLLSKRSVLTVKKELTDTFRGSPKRLARPCLKLYTHRMAQPRTRIEILNACKQRYRLPLSKNSVLISTTATYTNMYRVFNIFAPFESTRKALQNDKTQFLKPIFQNTS